MLIIVILTFLRVFDHDSSVRSNDLIRLLILSYQSSEPPRFIYSLLFSQLTQRLC